MEWKEKKQKLFQQIDKISPCLSLPFAFPSHCRNSLINANVYEVIHIEATCYTHTWCQAEFLFQIIVLCVTWWVCAYNAMTSNGEKNEFVIVFGFSINHSLPLYFYCSHVLSHISLSLFSQHSTRIYYT